MSGRVQDINFKELLSQIMQKLASQNKVARQVEFSLHIRKDLPFLSDPQQLESLLSLLLSNRLMSTFSTGLKPFIYVKIHSHRAGASIVLRDNGKLVPGVVPEDVVCTVDGSLEIREEATASYEMIKHAVNNLKGCLVSMFEPSLENEIYLHLPAHYN